MMNSPLFEKRIVLGVTGSIACYKAVELASKLHQHGALVDVILTEAAAQFVSTLTFQSVSGRHAFLDADMWGGTKHVQHITLGHNADLLVVAPATANTIAKLAHGIADNLLTVTALAANCPLILAPAMDGGMFSHPATQENIDLLVQRGAVILGPAEGYLASGMIGLGRMVEPSDLLNEIRLISARGGPLAGRKVVVTAGGTWEAIDPVRGITNRSSGKQGFAIAQAALDQGAETILICGPNTLKTPLGASRIDITSADEMLSAVLEHTSTADALLMGAAVADFRPAKRAAQKIKKGQIELEAIPIKATADILLEVADMKSRLGYPKITVGFAAESQALLENARAKLQLKQLDLIVANDITAMDAGFAVETNRVTIIAADGETEALPLMSKSDVADRIIARIVDMLAR
jgi:phosphopantothenoylcysteine decarboxylase/phosphopantothenate--cysteine ligase